MNKPALACLSGILSVCSLLAGANLVQSAQTDFDSLQGLGVCFAGLIFAIIFSGLLAEHISGPRLYHPRKRRPF